MFKDLDTELDQYEHTFDYVEKRIDSLIEDVNNKLPAQVDLFDLSKYGSLLPYKAQVIKASQLYRSNELADSILRLVNSQNYTAAAILVRSLLETSALIYFVGKKIDSAVKNKSTEDIDDILMSALMGYSGGKKEKSKSKPIQILTAIDHAEKKVNGYRREYDQLSEYTHPNWFGAHNMYAIIIEGKYVTKFDKNLNELESSWKIIYPPLFLSLILLIHACDWIDKITPEFTKICDQNSPNYMSG